MIILAGEFTIKPDMRAEAIEHLQRMSTASQAEAGCQAYKFYADLSDPNRIFLYEAWDNADALALHAQTPHMAEFRKHTPNFRTAPMVMKRYTAEPILPTP